YATMLPLSEADKDCARLLKLPSSPSRAWATFDQTAAIASALQSMDRLSLGVEGRPQPEIGKREQLEDKLEAGIAEIEAIVAPRDQELADEALRLLDMIQAGEIGYADAVHIVSTTGEIAPVLEQLF